MGFGSHRLYQALPGGSLICFLEDTSTLKCREQFPLFEDSPCNSTKFIHTAASRDYIVLSLYIFPLQLEPCSYRVSSISYTKFSRCGSISEYISIFPSLFSLLSPFSLSLTLTRSLSISFFDISFWPISVGRLHPPPTFPLPALTSQAN